MVTTANRQKQAKNELDHKLAASHPDRALLEELAVACAQDSSPANTFQYAFALSKSRETSELRYAVSLLDGLVSSGFEHQMDCMYGAATALYLLGDFEEARARCEAILRAQPHSRVAKELHLASVEAQEQYQQQQFQNAAVKSVAAAAAVGILAGVAGLLLSNGGKKR
jgi:fission 1 protein